MPANRLIHEQSPYLLQHAHNPVDWHPWSEEAFRRAHEEDKPIFLSIGYATCHWCHVMEKESFEDSETARQLNETFVSIKVDREERPDIDAVYMAACQMITGGGGWPLTIFMTPAKKPFFAATYLPKHNRFGRTGLIELCRQVKNIWADQRAKILDSASALTRNLGSAFAFTSGQPGGPALLNTACSQIGRGYDADCGGFGPPPKFPTPHRLRFLLHCHHRRGTPNTRQMVAQTLSAMRLGGIWDHVGFGFHRYATDRNWLVPHFEKMLYDQALLSLGYLEAHQIIREPLLEQTAEEIFSYVQRDLTSPEGGFYAAEDADSDGEEGKFYHWRLEEVREVLGPDEAAFWEPIFNLKEDGNFAEETTGRKSGANILHLTHSLAHWARKLNLPPAKLANRWAAARQKLFGARHQRVHPLKDDKILTDWNGLMIAALALGARVLDKPEYAKAARGAVNFIWDNLRDRKGRLLHRFRAGTAGIDGHADDYAFLIMGLLALYAAVFEIELLERAIALQTIMLKTFWDDVAGGFFLTSADAGELPVRPKELYDGAIPSANSVSMGNLLRLARLTGDPQWDRAAQNQLRAFAGSIQAQPPAFTHFLMGIDAALTPPKTVVIVGDLKAETTREMILALNRAFVPDLAVLLKTEQNSSRLAQLAPFTVDLRPDKRQTVAYVCNAFADHAPASDAQSLLAAISPDLPTAPPAPAV